MSVLVTIEAVVIVLLALLVAGLLRSHAEILRALHGLGAGISPDPDSAPTTGATSRGVTPRSTGGPASDVVGTSPAGDSVAIGVVGTDEHTLLAFLSTGCLSCAGFWEAFADIERSEVPGKARLVVVTAGPEQESQSRVAALAPPDIPVVMSSEAWQAYQVPVAPYFAYVDGTAGRVIGEGAAGTWEHVADLMRQALADAGLADRSSRGSRSSRLPAGDDASRVDADLLSAGLYPGHPSLFKSPVAPESHGGDG